MRAEIKQEQAQIKSMMKQMLTTMFKDQIPAIDAKDLQVKKN